MNHRLPTSSSASTTAAARPLFAMPNNDDDDGATILDDGLSTCDDHDDDHENRRRSSSNRILTTYADAARQSAEAKRYRHFTCALFVTTFLISAIAYSAKIYNLFPRRDQNIDSDDYWKDIFGNGLQEKENALRLNQTLEYLIQTNAVVNSKVTLGTKEEDDEEFYVSAQYGAAIWIAQQDKLRIPIPSPPPPMSSSATTSYQNSSIFSNNSSSSNTNDNNNNSNSPKSSEEYQFLQRYSLAVLFFATGGIDTWIYKLNFLRGVHECEGWFDIFVIDDKNDDVFPFGVICDGEPNYETTEIMEEDVWRGTRTVTAIVLPPRNNMWGSLPPELYHLQYLKTLFISDNEMLSGEIPFQYGWWKFLDALALTKNNLIGKIPHSFAYLTKLRTLRLEANHFSGDTVKGDFDFLKEMTSLEDLALDYNANITGTLPEFVSDLSKLKALSMSNTKIYGTLPSSLSRLTELEALFVDDCDFEGSMAVLQNMRNLTHVYLEDNSFNDTIDDTFFANCTSLVHLDISNCSFAGTVPGHLFNNLSRLEVLDMSLNKLGGVLPAEALSNIHEGNNLTFLSLHTNNITGTIPPSIGRLQNLTVLDLSNNQFSGSIPWEEVGDLNNLEILFLGRNNFNKTPVATWIRNMTGLTELSLARSSLTGSIPTWLGELTQLMFLDLGGNNLTGTIPSSLGNLTALMVLILKSNNLEGELGLHQLAQLEVLLIDDNDLSGNTDAICVHEITYFISDCGGSHNINGTDAEIECSCCTLCCRDENTTCNDSEWLGNHEGMWETGYNRVKWVFEDGMISPFVNYNYIQYVEGDGV